MNHICRMNHVSYGSFRMNHILYEQELQFEEVGGLLTENISVLFVRSRALLQKHAEFNKLI